MTNTKSNTKKQTQIKEAIRVQEHTLRNLQSMMTVNPESVALGQQILGSLRRQLASVSPERNTSEMTYRERYSATTKWAARHLAKDLMEMNGPDEFITERDDQRINELEQAA
jgi:hypothetical protein